MTIGLFVLTAAARAYFTDQFGTFIDVDMIRNVFETDAAESRDLLSVRLGIRIAFFGVIPLLAVCRLVVNFIALLVTPHRVSSAETPAGAIKALVASHLEGEKK